MRKRLVSLTCAVAVLIGTASVAIVPTGCATVAGDPVGTNAARYVQTGSVYKAALVGWSAVLDRDVRREQPLLSQETYANIKRIRLQLDTLFDEWGRSVAAGQPFNNADTLYSLLDALSRYVTEYNR